MPHELQLLNKLLFLTSSTESFKLTYVVHPKYNNLLAYHNDLEQRVAILEDADESQVNNFSSLASRVRRESCLDLKDMRIIKDAEFKLSKYFVSNVVTHKSLDFLQNPIVEKMDAQIFVGANIQIRAGGVKPSLLQRKFTESRITDELKTGVRKSYRDQN